MSEHAPPSGLLGPVSLDRCHLIVCAPLTKSEFADAPENWRLRFQSWSKLKSAYRAAGLDVDRQVRILELLQKSGLKLSRSANAQSFEAAAVGDAKVIFLLAHCEGGREIQFWDQSLFIHELAECVPKDATFVLYGAVCAAVGFLESFKSRAPGSIISSPGDVTEVGVAGALLVATLVLSAILNGETVYSAFLKANLSLSA